MPIPSANEIEEPLLQEIVKQGGEVKPKDVYEPLAQHFALTPAERDDKLPKGANRWTNRVMWARQLLVEQGNLDGTTRGVWRITEKGRQRIGDQKSIPSSEASEPPTLNQDVPLTPTTERLLQQLIAGLRRRILIDEALVRRIYHALLAGHVILTGPPGTGKTELARLVPELLWQTDEAAGSSADPFANPVAQQPTTRTAYTTTLVTATDEWSVRTLIGGLAPQSDGGQVSYRVQYGYLTRALLDNWSARPDTPLGWSSAERVSLRATSMLNGGEQEFRGRWLVIDEFNRASIDLALGEALTALGGAERLRVPVDGGTAELPLPKDFRIIGTLNSFDRNYLNQISEALKRRFAFIEVVPPSRAQRSAEQAIVLFKALRSITHLSPDTLKAGDTDVTWQNIVKVAADATGTYQVTWDANAQPFRDVWEYGWRTYEVIRVYRQLGTAQAIAFVRQMLIAGVVQDYTSADQWRQALDTALCDTIADQLQVLLPDELDALLLVLNSGLDQATTVTRYNALLNNLNERRRTAQIEAMGAIVGADRTPVLDDEQVTSLIDANDAQVAAQAIRDCQIACVTSLPMPSSPTRETALRSGALIDSGCGSSYAPVPSTSA